MPAALAALLGPILGILCAGSLLREGYLRRTTSPSITSSTTTTTTTSSQLSGVWHSDSPSRLRQLARSRSRSRSRQSQYSRTSRHSHVRSPHNRRRAYARHVRISSSSGEQHQTGSEIDDESPSSRRRRRRSSMVRDVSQSRTPSSRTRRRRRMSSRVEGGGCEEPGRGGSADEYYRDWQADCEEEKRDDHEPVRFWGRGPTWPPVPTPMTARQPPPTVPAGRYYANPNVDISSHSPARDTTIRRSSLVQPAVVAGMTAAAAAAAAASAQSAVSTNAATIMDNADWPVPRRLSESARVVEDLETGLGLRRVGSLGTVCTSSSCGTFSSGTGSSDLNNDGRGRSKLRRLRRRRGDEDVEDSDEKVRRGKRKEKRREKKEKERRERRSDELAVSEGKN